jgi:hypothetical protein
LRIAYFLLIFPYVSHAIFRMVPKEIKFKHVWSTY